MTLEFEGEAFEWRGPAPYVFVRVPPELAAEVRAIAPLVTYGWGVVPATIRVGATTLTTSLFPKDGGYLVPLKVAIQRAENVEVGDRVDVRVEIAIAPKLDR